MEFIKALENAFVSQSNAENALPMEQYMKNNFPFFGIKTVERRTILKSLSLEFQEEIKSNSRSICWELYLKKEREFHYCAIEIAMQNLKKKWFLEDIKLIENLLITNSWWDSVDTISKYLLGAYLQQFPSEIIGVIEAFSNSDNRWLNRSTILFQLGYKSKTDFDLLKSLCDQNASSKEFFIQKAIGWALREYAKINPMAVKAFVEQANLKPLSKKEALKNIIIPNIAIK